MRYTGTHDARCPITLTLFEDLEWPVAFLNAPFQPYECKYLVQWLMLRGVSPLTNLPVYWSHSLLEIIAPLENSKVDPDIVCAYIAGHNRQPDNRRVFNGDFVLAFFVLLLLLSVSYLFGWPALRVVVVVLAVGHSFCITKSTEGHIHLMCAVYVFAVYSVLLILGEKQSVPIEVAVFFGFLLKISSRIVDVYAVQIRRAFSF